MHPKPSYTPPGSLTLPLKIYHPKRKVCFQPAFFRGYGKLRGCIYIYICFFWGGGTCLLLLRFPLLNNIPLLFSSEVRSNEMQSFAIPALDIRSLSIFGFTQFHGSAKTCNIRICVHIIHIYISYLIYKIARSLE